MIYRNRAHEVEEAAESWKGDHEDAAQARDAKDLVREWLALAGYVCDWQSDSFARQARIEVLNRIYIDLPREPDVLLAEHVVPFADVFTYPFRPTNATLTGQAAVFVFIVRRNDSTGELTVLAGRCELPLEGGNGIGS